MAVTPTPSPADQPLEPPEGSSGSSPADFDSPNIEKIAPDPANQPPILKADDSTSYSSAPSTASKPKVSDGFLEKGLISRIKDARASVDAEGGGGMSFMDHLMELRKRLWISLVAVLICMGLALYWTDAIFELLKRPVDDINADFKVDETGRQILKEWGRQNVIELQTTNPLSIMMTVVWLGIGAGLILSSPILVYEVWAFVAPGLKPNEKRAIQPVLFGGIFFFIGGCALAYKALVPVSMTFLATLAVKIKVRPDYTIDDYMSLLLNMMFISGLICEMPLIVAVLARLSLVKPESLLSYWRSAMLAAFVLGAVLSPGTDVIAMLLFSFLLLSLYFISILFAYIFYPKQPVK